MKKYFLFLFFCFLLVSVSAASVANITTQQDATDCLNNSKKLMMELVDSNLSVKRVNDTIYQAEIIYNSQVSLVSRGRKADFSLVSSYCDSVSEVYSLAINSRDALSVLLKFYNESITPEMNSSSIDQIISEINFEIASERYEKVQPLIDKAYQEISDVRARSTTLNLFVDSTSRGLKTFFIKNWRIILAVFVILVILWFSLRKPVRAKLLNYRLDKLAQRRESIKKLVMRSQKEYFEKGNIADSDYKIRIANYAELIRDIDRQVPLLREELAKLKGVKE
jgi:hypothetical protein